jgi:hypothetical protein
MTQTAIATKSQNHSGQTVSVPKPENGAHITAASLPGGVLELGFDPSTATSSRVDNNLVFEVDGGTITLTNFFAVGDQDLPSLRLPDGTEVASTDFFANSDLDLSTAAAPVSATPPSSGTNYADDSGDLLGGVDRLGSLGTDFWNRSTGAPEQGSSRGLPVGPEPGGPDDPVVPDPSHPLEYVARGVMYRGEPLQVDLLRVDVSGETAWKASSDGSLPADVLFTFYDEDGFAVSDEENPFGDVEYEPATGCITFTNPPTGDGVFYCVISDGTNSYTMQLVTRSVGEFDSAAMDDATPQGTLLYGEWHAGPGSEYLVSSTERLSDTLDFSGTVADATIDIHHGDNTLRIKATADAAGDDAKAESYGASDSSITAGDGDNDISIKSTANASGDEAEAEAHGVSGGSIEMGGGDLHQFGGLNGRTLSADEAKSAV